MDAISDDGTQALTVIAFIGNVFSPYYAAARRRGSANPLNHVCINAILYTPGGACWAMTERGESALSRSSAHLAIGPSGWFWTGERLSIEIDEWTVPLPRRLRGRISIDPGPVFQSIWRLDKGGRHIWRPIAPCGTAEVDFDQPRLNWKGRVYVDMNTGDEPLEAAFRNWNWSREDCGATTRILYDLSPRTGAARGIALDYGADGSCVPFDPPPASGLPATGWRVARETRAAAERPAHVVRILEDTPFYSRSLLAFGTGPNETRAMHESVDFDRFRSRWVQTLLPFRMPRRARQGTDHSKFDPSNRDVNRLPHREN